MNNHRLAHYIMLLLASLTGTGSVLAEDASANWYQVELFIFANTNPNAGTNERWPQNLGLSYPDNLVELIYPTQEVEENVLEAEQTEEALSETIEPQLTAIPDVPTEPLQDDEAEEPNGPEAYAVLADENKQLQRHVNRLLRTGQHRLLFHETWLQPVEDRKQAVSLLIRAGNQYDRHYELEGYVSFSVERYLHINTDLWLSSFISTIGTEQMPWPVLPTPPTVIKAQQQIASELNLSAPMGTGFFGSQSRPFELLFDQQYSVDRTVVMRQHRRMRSNELHYLDHPLMGILVKVTPYEKPKPAPETEQTEEVESAQEDAGTEQTVTTDTNSPEAPVATEPKPL